VLYLDTSVLVTALTNERESGRIQRWLERQSPDDIAISDWVATEFASALSLKLRTGQMDSLARQAASAAFAELRSVSFRSLTVEPRHFQIAAGFVERHTIGLRAADALHVAIAADHGAMLCTRDKTMASACASLGVSSIEP